MIHSLSSDQDSFRDIRFSEGFNAIIADCGDVLPASSTQRGLGKSTLLDIVHFCLGGKPRNTLLKNETKGWSFSLEFDAGPRHVIATRNTGRPSDISIQECAVLSAPTQPQPTNPDSGKQATSIPAFQPDSEPKGLAFQRQPFFSEKNQQRQASQSSGSRKDLASWTAWLGTRMFGLDAHGTGRGRPTFRSLVSYFGRRGDAAFSVPFDSRRREPKSARQVLNAFLLGLEVDDAAEFRSLEEEDQHLRNLQSAARAGILNRLVGSTGELESERVSLELKSDKEQQELRNFRVHPQYSEISTRANELTKSIHDLVLENHKEEEIVALYRSTIVEDAPSQDTSVEEIYREAGVVLGELVQKRFEDVRQFHRILIANRREFLRDELDRLATSIDRRSRLIKDMSEERAKLLSILKTHGALEEYMRLQELHGETVSRLNEVKQRLNSLREIEDRVSALKIRRLRLIRRARRDVRQRVRTRENAVTIFNDYTHELYNTLGTLAIDIGDKGFEFSTTIKRSGSHGVKKMEIFCFDLMLVRLWAKTHPESCFLIHDSTLFDGVNRRQVAHALQLARREAELHGFQYICALNRGMIPDDEFSSGLSLDSFVRLTLTDDGPQGSLLGIRF